MAAVSPLYRNPSAMNLSWLRSRNLLRSFLDLFFCSFLIFLTFHELSWYNKNHQVYSVLKGEIRNMSLLPRYFLVPVCFCFKIQWLVFKPIVILGLADS